MKILIILCFNVLMGLAVFAGDFYTSANKNTYYIEPGYTFKWFEAHIECSNRNMTLFTIDDEDKFYDLYNILISGKFSFKPPHVWIGGIGAQKKFTWISNGKQVVWKYGSPDNSGNHENCIQIYQGTNHINDNNCDTKFGFVCEDSKWLSLNNNNAIHHQQKYKDIIFNINPKPKD